MSFLLKKMQDQTILVSQEDLGHIMEEKDSKKPTYKINNKKSDLEEIVILAEPENSIWKLGFNHVRNIWQRS